MRRKTQSEQTQVPEEETQIMGPRILPTSEPEDDLALPNRVGGGSGNPAPDPFDLARLVLPQDFAERAGVKKLLVSVPVRRPKPQEFVRVHPEPAYRHSLALLNLEEDREYYLLVPAVAQAIPEEFISVTLFTAISRQGNLFFWPIKEPGPDGRVLAWHTSARDAAEAAMRRWIRVKANMTAGCYDVFEAAGAIADPEWPTGLDFQDLLKIAFKGRLVEDLDHPALQRLRGA